MQRYCRSGQLTADLLLLLLLLLLHPNSFRSGLAHLIKSFGAAERLLAKDTSCFRSLAKSIIYQQVCTCIRCWISRYAWSQCTAEEYVSGHAVDLIIGSYEPHQLVLASRGPGAA
jgi:hypothetical protein